ncbi:MAG TPA: hypothetical protein VEM41_03820, partial [Actinomycetota bacterium]|nr:hypothetical protein [Actinomycetota bacterium]
RAGSVDWVAVGNVHVDDCARWQLPAPAAMFSVAPVRTVAVARLAAFRRAGRSCTATFRIATNATQLVAIQVGTFVIEDEIRPPNGASYASRSGLSPAWAPEGTAWALTVLSSPDECAGATNCVP